MFLEVSCKTSVVLESKHVLFFSCTAGGLSPPSKPPLPRSQDRGQLDAVSKIEDTAVGFALARKETSSSVAQRESTV